MSKPSPVATKALWMIALLIPVRSATLHAQELAPELAPGAAKFKEDIAALDKQKEAEISRISETYIAALDGAEAKATAAGNIKAVTAISQERNDAKSGDLREADPTGLPRSLHNPRKSCVDGIARVFKDDAAKRDRLKSDYLRTLAALQSRAAGNAALVAQINDEKDRALRDITPSSPAGILTSFLWTLGVETWECAPNGKLIQRKPSPPGWPGKSWKLSANRRGVECVFGNGHTGTYPFENGRLYHWDKALGEFKREPLK
jgi:hypothetical protein